MVKTVVAFDPGKITGVAAYTQIDEVGFITTCHFNDSTLVDEVIKESDIVIYEVPYRRPQTDLIVFEVKGAILERARTLNKKIQPQQVDVLKFIDAAYTDFMKCKKLRGRLIHEKDALRHLVYFLLKTNILTIQEIEEILI